MDRLYLYSVAPPGAIVLPLALVPFLISVLLSIIDVRLVGYQIDYGSHGVVYLVVLLYSASHWIITERSVKYDVYLFPSLSFTLVRYCRI